MGAPNYNMSGVIEELGHRHAQREDHGKTQRGNGHLPPRTATSEGIHPANTIISDFQCPELGGKKACSVV